jgi:hypothetical protein
MRLTCGLAIALWLSVPCAGTFSQQQDSSGSANVNVQAPASTTPTENAPAGQAPVETATAAPANSETPVAETQVPKSVAKKKAHPASVHRTAKRRKRAVQTPSDAPRKVVVREGGATEPAAQIVPGMSRQEATRQRRNAEKWLGSTDDQLKQLVGRSLDARQRETVGQIHNYIDGALSALKEGDVGRASTLAQKAHLLSDDLVKH